MELGDKRDIHQPVLVREILECLDVKPGGIYVDATLGSAGHALALLGKLGSKGRLVGVDQDEEGLEIARERLKAFGSRVLIIKKNFTAVREVLREKKMEGVDGIYADLGVSSLQLSSAHRGFSFGKEGPIDMRMDLENQENVFKKIQRSNERELTQILKEYGEERLAPKIARGLLEKMRRGELKTTLDVASVAAATYPPSGRFGRIHPATRTFQALRIWVNSELESLKVFLNQAPHLLNRQGRLCVISYHSLEDRLVKHAFRELSKRDNKFKIMTKKPITPTAGEISLNPRARSAKLRVLNKADE